MKTLSAAPVSTARSALPSMLMPAEPPLVSCASQRSDRPSFQARSTAESGASENDATAMPWMSVAYTRRPEPGQTALHFMRDAVAAAVQDPGPNAAAIQGVGGAAVSRPPPFG